MIANKEVVAAVVQMYRWIVTLPEEYSEYTEGKKAYLLQLSSMLERVLNV